MKRVALLATMAVLGAGPAWALMPAPGAGKACTEMGCSSGVHVSIPDALLTGAGDYTFEITATGDGVQKAQCKGRLPFSGCNGQITCEGDLQVMIDEIGCMLPSDAQSFGNIHISDTSAKSVEIKISRDGTPLVSSVKTLSYKTLQPNGQGCEPVCRQAVIGVEAIR